MDLVPARTGSEVAIVYLFRTSGGIRWSAWVSLQGAFQDVWSSSSCDRSGYVLMCMQQYPLKRQAPVRTSRPPWRLRSRFLHWSDRGKRLLVDGIDYTSDCAGGTIWRADLPCGLQTTLVVVTPGPPMEVDTPKLRSIDWVP